MRPGNRTKIVTTIGPATSSSKALEAIIRAGADVIRLNGSHGTVEQHAELAHKARKAAERLQRPLMIFMDMPGPKIRIGDLEADEYELVQRSRVSFVHGDGLGTDKRLTISYAGLFEHAYPKQKIFLADGTLELQVVEAHPEEVVCKVKRGGVIRPRKGVNLPGVPIDLPTITKRDEHLATAAVGFGVDALGLSFVRSAEDLHGFRRFLGEAGKDLFLISKIEREEALADLDAVITASDAIMIARGDLGVETPVHKLAILQKSIIRRAQTIGRPVITATQMLLSMVRGTRPTRAEVTDVTNAILDGTDAIMLSEETAVGRHPAACVGMMSKIATAAEGTADYQHISRMETKRMKRDITTSVGWAAGELADRLGAKAIITPTLSGRTARMASLARPSCWIVAPTTSVGTAHRLALVSGIHPVCLDSYDGPETILESLVPHTWLKGGDLVVVTEGVPYGESGHTNSIKILNVPGE